MASPSTSATPSAPGHPAPHTRILIVGGGFGGVYAARRLALRLRGEAEITLVDRHASMLYTPMLTEAAGRSISLQHAAVPYKHLLRGITFVQAEVTGIDAATRSITLHDGRTLSADHLVLALGSVSNYRDTDGAREHSFTMKTLDDACCVQQRVLSNVRTAAGLPPGSERDRLLRAVVAGGGYTGVETAAALNDLMRDEAEMQGLPRNAVHLTIIEPEGRLMRDIPASLGTYGQRVLEADGITVRTDVEVKSVEDDQTVTLSDGSHLSHGLLVWDAGIRPSPLVEDTSAPKGKRHGFQTDSAFRVQGMPGVWAMGDCAEIPQPGKAGATFAPTAQNATREGVLLADNIVQILRKRPVRPFRYRQIGSLAVVSRHRGVANVYGINVRGVPAWLLWRAIYIAKCPTMAARAGLIGDYLRLAAGRRFVPAATQVPAHAQAQHTEAPAPAQA